MIDALAVLISIPYVACTPATGQEICNGVYSVSDAVAVLLSIPKMFYTPSMREKFFNLVIFCGRCFSRSHKYSIFVIKTFSE